MGRFIPPEGLIFRAVASAPLPMRGGGVRAARTFARDRFALVLLRCERVERGGVLARIVHSPRSSEMMARPQQLHLLRSQAYTFVPVSPRTMAAFEHLKALEGVGSSSERSDAPQPSQADAQAALEIAQALLQRMRQGLWLGQDASTTPGPVTE